MDQCPFCEKPLDGEPLQASCVLTAKGCAGIHNASNERGTAVHVVPGQKVHTECRKVFCSKPAIESYLNRKRSTDSSKPLPKRLRSGDSVFSYNDNCLFCGESDKHGGKRKGFELIPVKTFDFQNKVSEVCESRTDEWAETVKHRIIFAQDLHAADAVYHNICSVNFRTGKKIPQCFARSDDRLERSSAGRPTDLVRAEAFARTMEYLEANDDEQVTVNALIKKMQEYMGDSDCEAYTFKYMKEQLHKRFGERIIITEINGVSNIVTFRGTASSLLRSFYDQPKEVDSEVEKLRLITTAAKLIQSDIKSVTQPMDVYPTSFDMSSTDQASAFLPDSLKLFLDTLFVGKEKGVKICSVGQAMMQATRPRILIPPLMLGLGVQMHTHFASRFLIDTLYAHGFSCSYGEVLQYERNAAMARSTVLRGFLPGSFIQYTADNVDHNVCTLDGKNTFHGMGIIASVTPKVTQHTLVQRTSISSKDIAQVGRISIRQFVASSGGLERLKYEKLPEVESDESKSPNVTLIWKLSLSVRPIRPSWSGFMQMVHKGDHPGVASVIFLPMIDLNPSDLTCINSTLHFVTDHAQRYDVTPVLTFDQPLWWKALTIVQSSETDSKLRMIVLRLGGFHTLMSFLGCMGHLMGGSGLKYVLALVYAENTTQHILGGKAVARALRAHFLVDAALNTLLVLQAFGVDENDDPVSTPELKDAGTLFDALLSGTVSQENATSSDVLVAITEKIQQVRDSLKDERTAQLWFLYMEMVDIVRDFLTSERLGDWELHLRTMQKMLPYLAASGHNLYTKSLHVYLQMMSELPQQHPDVHEKFLAGLHVVRRSDRYWAGLSADLIIEQVLMRSLKSTGGLTRGRGMTEAQRVVWALSRSVCAELNQALQCLTNTEYTTSEQHKDMSQSRQDRDSGDALKILSYLRECNPFRENGPLINISNGVSADGAVNVDKAKDVGQHILNEMVGKSVAGFVFRKKDLAVTLQSKASVKINDELVPIDPQLLFQRLIITGTQSGALSDTFKYELCSYPPALFEGPGIMLAANKPVLAKAMLEAATDGDRPSNSHDFVIDGGALLHRVPWQVGETYDEIINHYVDYVTRRYGRASVVFDGYSAKPSTKDATHQRRTKGRLGRKVTFEGSMRLAMGKDEFLTNSENKQRFIHLLGEGLEQVGCDVQHAAGDADVLIVQTTLSMSHDKDAVLVGEDTDLLVLLVHYTDSRAHFRTFFMSQPKQTSARREFQVKYVNINALCASLGKPVCKNILFLHALLGCDTTSRLHGIGKGVSLKLMKDSKFFAEQATVFGNSASGQKDVELAGERALVTVYKGKQSDTLDCLRHQRFQEKVTVGKTSLHPRELPPTSASAKFHSLRVFHQIQEWRGVELDAEKWGWKIADGKMVPLQTELAAAPKSLLDLVRCSCKTGCNDKRCGCSKQGLPCTLACANCRGICANSDHEDLTNSDSDDGET